MNIYERLQDPNEMLKISVENERTMLWTAFPGKIVSFNAALQTAQVQPAFASVTVAPDGTHRIGQMPVLPDVPIVFPNAGGYSLTLPIAPGDSVLVMISARNIDPWWSTGDGSGLPLEFRMHDLSDAFAIPSPRPRTRPLANYSTNSIMLRNDARSAYVEINGTTININTSGVTNINASGNLNVTAPTSTFNGRVVINGESILNGNTTISGTVTSSGINLTTHIHSDPQGGFTGGPTN